MEEEDEEIDEETDTIEELHRQIMYLNGYIPAVTGEVLKSVYTRRLNMLQCLSTAEVSWYIPPIVIVLII